MADSLIVIHPGAWESVVTNLMRFNIRLGFNVTNVTTEAFGRRLPSVPMGFVCARRRRILHSVDKLPEIRDDAEP